jgi:hypothetical protein
MKRQPGHRGRNQWKNEAALERRGLCGTFRIEGQVCGPVCLYSFQYPLNSLPPGGRDLDLAEGE